MPYSVLRRGAIGVVYRVSPCIVLKRPTIDGQKHFLKENRIYEILDEHPPCAELVRSYLRTDEANFLEYMTQLSLSERLQHNAIYEKESGRVLEVSYLEPYSLRTQWMSALAKGTAWLESLGYAHGDLRPENVLLNAQSHLKIADFDCTDIIGSHFEACIPPYGRILGSEAGPDKGTAGTLGPRTEQFALGSLFYYINYGMEAYDDQNLGEDHKRWDHGPILVARLQQKIFPKLSRDPEIDCIIHDCWHGKFVSISKLSQTIAKRFELSLEESGAMSETDFASKRNECLRHLNEGILDKCSQEKDHSFQN